MRSALALSALLLLWPPLPSLSQQGASTTTNPPDTTKSTTEQTPTGKVTDTTTTKQSTVIATTNQKTTSVQTSQSTTTTPNGQGSGPNTPVTTSSTNAATTSSQDGKKATSTEPQTSRDVTTKTVTTLGGNPMNQTPSMVNISDTTPATPSSTSPGGTKQVTSGPTTQNPTGSTTEELNKTTTTSSNADTLTGHTPTPQGASTTLTTLATSPGNQQSPSKMPALPGTSACKTPSPTVSSPEPTTTSSSAPLATTAPHGSSTPPLTPDLENSTVRCEPPETWNEKMLLLKNTSLCAGSRADDKLVTLLCQAVKASFNRSHDQCHIRLVPIPESQAVAIKEVTIQTNRLPKDLFDSLKVRWDDLKKLGVSDMRLGNEGPPKDTEDRFSMPLIITIVCMASFLLLVAALYGCCHQRLAQRKDQQRLTEELQTVENGYHDNPTLEVMETSSEMQEKKVVNLNGELGDSWIVPLDNLIKDDLDEEEDTHL